MSCATIYINEDDCHYDPYEKLRDPEMKTFPFEDPKFFEKLDGHIRNQALVALAYHKEQHRKAWDKHNLARDIMQATFKK